LERVQNSVSSSLRGHYRLHPLRFQMKSYTKIYPFAEGVVKRFRQLRPGHPE
jgi:hypothetical protein